MTYQTIKTSTQGAAFIVTLNRPEKRNAVSLQMMSDIIDALAVADGDASISTAVITGGDKFFSAGADLNEVLQNKTVPGGLAYLKRWHRLCATVEELGKPVVAAIEGFCMTGGLELALACDMRIGAEGTTYAVTSAKIGTVAGAGGTQRLPRIIGMARALELMFAADPIDAAEAYRIGLINKLCAKGTALESAVALAATYAQRAPISLRFVKRAVHRGMQMDLASAIEFETMLLTTIYSTQDKHEGISAFLEKRKPGFKGL